MSILIDNLCNTDRYRCSEVRMHEDGKYYRAKPVAYWSRSNLIDAWRVLLGKSRAFHYKEDEQKKR